VDDVSIHERPTEISIRDAVVEDAAVLSDLAAQLGYPTAVDEIASRLARLKSKPGERVIVAADGANRAVGWTTVRITEHMYGEPFVEVSGFVVDQKARGQGVGRTMMHGVEKWATDRGLSKVRLNANAMRPEAHKFYKTIGFQSIKQQFVFQKSLNVKG
jgi:GNAT superfamily N-acetyltransferase